MAAAAVLALAGCTSTGGGPAAAPPSAPLPAPTADRLPPVAPAAVGEARRITRPGLAERMGDRLGELVPFPARLGEPVAAAYDINRPFYVAAVGIARPAPEDPAARADLALQAAVGASSAGSRPRLAGVRTVGAAGGGAVVVRCAALVLQGSSGPWEMPACGWADDRSTGVVLDGRTVSPRTPADLDAAAELVARVRAALAAP